MLDRFVREARALAADAQDEAKRSGSPTVEAEHLLLALARSSSGPGGEVLRQAGLDEEAVRQALDDEFDRSLAAVGVSSSAFGPLRRVPLAGRPRWATSAKAALERALVAAREIGDRRIGSGHVLIGLVDARHGTVPRALRASGNDPAELAAAARGAIPAWRSAR